MRTGSIGWGLAIGLGAFQAVPIPACAAPAATLETVATLDVIVNGVTVAPDDRVFVSVPPLPLSQGLSVAELVDGKLRPYPDADWNHFAEGQDPARHFVGVNALRIGADGALWVVDKGSVGIGGTPAPGAAKLVRIEIASGTVSRVYDLTSVTGPGSFLDDVRFHGKHAYLTEAGRGGLIILDLETGTARTVLERDPSTQGAGIVAEGKAVRLPDGHPLVVNADQLELSPDKKYLYFQPPSGPMSRIETRFLDDPALSDAVLHDHVEHFAATGSTGGTAIDADGTIFASSLDKDSILRIDTKGHITTLISDRRLAWGDAMWIDRYHRLWIPATQLNRTAPLNGGVDAIERPFRIYRLALAPDGARSGLRNHHHRRP